MKMTGKSDRRNMPDLNADTEHGVADMEDSEMGAGAAAMLEQTDNYTEEMEESEGAGEEEGEQPTLATILRAGNKCTASVNNLQARFGSLGGGQTGSPKDQGMHNGR